jgi:hypothetical protein
MPVIVSSKQEEGNEMWYAVSVIMYVEFKDSHQNNYPVWENVYLVSAESAEEAFEKAEGFGREQQGDSEGTFTWEDRPARWVFAGVRKVIKCDERPDDGIEITYSQFLLKDKKSLDKLVNGETVCLIYEE